MVVIRWSNHNGRYIGPMRDRKELLKEWKAIPLRVTETMNKPTWELWKRMPDWKRNEIRDKIGHWSWEKE
tara:strand:+ start:1948 stop:2157 length:210 start_codon:yes stop_codon:yes gene_type:complete